MLIPALNLELLKISNLLKYNLKNILFGEDYLLTIHIFTNKNTQYTNIHSTHYHHTRIYKYKNTIIYPCSIIKTFYIHLE